MSIKKENKNKNFPEGATAKVKVDGEWKDLSEVYGKVYHNKKELLEAIELYIDEQCGELIK